MPHPGLRLVPRGAHGLLALLNVKSERVPLALDTVENPRFSDAIRLSFDEYTLLFAQGFLGPPAALELLRFHSPLLNQGCVELQVQKTGDLGEDYFIAPEEVMVVDY